jgi:hypothetical protein
MPKEHAIKGVTTSQRDPVATALWYVLLLTVAVTPFIVARVYAAFRTPKTILFQAAMLLIGGATAAWLLYRHDVAAERVFRHRLPIVLALAAVVWTAIVSLTAVQPVVARHAPLAVLCYATLFVATILFARGTLLPLMAFLLPAAANALFTILQALHLWSPVELDRIPQGREYAIGMLGNPDYVGTYLIVPCIAAIAAAVAFRRHRVLFIGLAALIGAGLFFAQSVTAVGALGIALLSFTLVARSTRIRLSVAAMLLAVGVGLAAYPPTRTRALQLARLLRAGQVNEFTSLRLPAFVVAADMFRERPLMGVGPGNFEAHYMSYKLAADERYPQWIKLGNRNFGEVHNDHLQLLAEGGLPAYALFLTALGHIVALSFRRSPVHGARAQYVRIFALPAVVGFAAVALGQFPLHLTATMSTSLFAVALAYAWSADESL